MEEANWAREKNRWEDNTKVDVKEIACEDVGWLAVLCSDCLYLVKERTLVCDETL